LVLPPGFIFQLNGAPAECWQWRSWLTNFSADTNWIATICSKLLAKMNGYQTRRTLSGWLSIRPKVRPMGLYAYTAGLQYIFDVNCW